jgi:hypothetical protein
MPKNEPLRRIDSQRTRVGAIYAGGGVGAGGVGGGVTDHGALTGLLDDDHSQYHNDMRGDARYVPLARLVAAGAGLAGGGYLGTDIALAVGAGDGIAVGADMVGVDGTVARNTWPVTAGNGLVGGGNLVASGITSGAAAISAL